MLKRLYFDFDKSEQLSEMDYVIAGKKKKIFGRPLPSYLSALKNLKDLMLEGVI